MSSTFLLLPLHLLSSKEEHEDVHVVDAVNLRVPLPCGRSLRFSRREKPRPVSPEACGSHVKFSLVCGRHFGTVV